MNFVTSVFKKYINKDEVKTQKNRKTVNDAPGPSTAEASKKCEVKESNYVAPAPKNEPQGPAPLSDEEDCFQDAQTMSSNITNDQKKLSVLEVPSNQGLNITKKHPFDNSIVKISDPQETPVESLNNTIEIFQHDDCQPVQDKSGDVALDNLEVNQAAKFVSLNDILFDSPYKLDTKLPRENVKPRIEANIDTPKSALGVLIQNVNEAFVCTPDTTYKNHEKNDKVQIEPIMAQENYSDEENSKASQDEEVETQKRKCEDVEEIVKKLKTDKYPDVVRVQENIENQNAPEKTINQFVLKPRETQDMDTCKIQIGENGNHIKFNEITNNLEFKESNNNTRDNEIVELTPEAANRSLEEHKNELKTEIEITSSEQITKNTGEQAEENQGTKTNVMESKENTEILKQEMDTDSRLLGKSDIDNIKEEDTQKNQIIQSMESYHNEKELIDDTFVEHKNKEDKLQQEGDLANVPLIKEFSFEKLMPEQNKSSVEIQNQQAQANLENLVPQKEDLSTTKELVNSLGNSESINKISDDKTLKQEGNKDNTYDLVNAPIIQEDSSKKVMQEQNKRLEEIIDQQTLAEKLVPQTEDLPSKKELTIDNDTSLEKIENKADTYDLVNAHIIQEDSIVKVMLAQNTSLVEIQNQESKGNLESLVAQKENLSSISKESVPSSTNPKSNELLKQERIELQDTYENFPSSPITIQEDSSGRVVLEKSLVEPESSNYQNYPELMKNQEFPIDENLNTKTDAINKLTEELEQPQANFKLDATENIEENLTEKIRKDSEVVVASAPKSILDLAKGKNYEQNLQKPKSESIVTTIQNSLGMHSQEDEQGGNKTFDRQDTKEFEKLERECKINFKSDATIDEENVINKPTNFGRQDTQEFENLEKKMAINEEKNLLLTDYILDELVAESKTDKKDDQCVITPHLDSETQISGFEKVKESDTKIVGEYKKTFSRQDTLEFEKLEKQCTEVACLDVLDELVAQSTMDNSISNTKLIESITCELVSTPCNKINENAFEKTMEENKSGQEQTVLEAPHQNNKTTFLEIHLQSKNAGKNQGETKSNPEEKDDNGKNKLLQIQVHSVNKNKQQNQLSKVEPQKEEKYRTVDEELKNKVEDLQLELETIRKMNRRKEKCIATSKVEKEESGNVISKYKNIINEYEKHIVQQNTDLEKLKIENERNMRHFTNTEMAFSDVFEKYEKAKYVIAAYAKNEDILLENLRNAEEQLTETETKCVAMKEQSFKQIKQAKQHIEYEKQKYNQELAKLQGQVKRLEIKATSLEVALKQKTDECQALASLCDDITGRHST
ncbi:unnamed protein product [Ceutorhynchus assimilis]|uniref:Transforming acidic coiled-coil-containing protein C-terminal domain-containing protein n=1 Tax=Ceutorhynchus assimilis TaxID=467358 RepID=A0A9N9QJ44_9CUCU|nr:unnamed protein product [Ceutorhynchus assimilis]